jgi:hypothetical protein
MIRLDMQNADTKTLTAALDLNNTGEVMIHVHREQIVKGYS